MCELLALSSRLPTSVTLSLSTFAQHRGADDGWGQHSTTPAMCGFIRSRKSPLKANGWHSFNKDPYRHRFSSLISVTRHAVFARCRIPNRFLENWAAACTFLPTMAGLTASNAIMPVAGIGIDRSARPIQRSHSASCSSESHRYGRAVQFPHWKEDLQSSRSLPPTWPPSVPPISFIRMVTSSLFMGIAACRQMDVLRHRDFGVFRVNAKNVATPSHGITQHHLAWTAANKK